MRKFLIIIPVYNDWDSVHELIHNIDKEITSENNKVSILVINDASTQENPNKSLSINNIQSVQILNLLNNTGHCKAIATTIKFIKDNIDYDYIIPMDGDGEDRPEEIKDFFKIINEEEDSTEIITANRIKRSEGFLFRICYQIHKLITFLLIGTVVRFGNYSCLSKKTVNKLMADSSIWISYSGSIIKNFSNIKSIKSIRGTRYFGPSKMNFFNLIKHSLSISAVFKESVLVKSAFVVLIFGLISYYYSAYFLIGCLFAWIFMLYIFFLSKNDDIKNLEKSLENVKNLSDWPKR